MKSPADNPRQTARAARSRLARRTLGLLILVIVAGVLPVAAVLADDTARRTLSSLPGLGAMATWTVLALSGMLIGARRVHIRSSDGNLTLGAEAPISILAALWLSPVAAFLAALVAGSGVLAAGRTHGRTQGIAAVGAGAIAAAAGSAAVRAFTAEPGATQYLAAAGIAAAIRVAVLVSVLLAVRLIAGSTVGSVKAGATSTLGALALLEFAVPTLSVGAAGPFADRPWIVFAIVLSAAGLTAVGLIALARATRDHDENQTLRDAFRRFVSSSVADRIIGDGSSGGTLDAIADQRTITVLFCDVQGFTSWAETASPREVVTDLNELLGDLASAVLATGGTIDKFTGDGLMAFWGAPSDQPDHADRAVRAAPLLLMRAREFNVRRAARGKIALEIGVGIHTGPAIVGPVGHKDRMDYTAMGDTVNVAARLESATRFQNCPILLSETTFLKLPIDQQRRCTRLASIDVKGRKERIRLYAPNDLVRHLGLSVESDAS